MGRFLRPRRDATVAGRHAGQRLLHVEGPDLVTLAALLGHSRVQMVMRYAHPVEEHKIEAISKLEEYNNQKRKAA